MSTPEAVQALRQHFWQQQRQSAAADPAAANASHLQASAGRTAHYLHDSVRSTADTSASRAWSDLGAWGEAAAIIAVSAAAVGRPVSSSRHTPSHTTAHGNRALFPPDDSNTFVSRLPCHGSTSLKSHKHQQASQASTSHQGQIGRGSVPAFSKFRDADDVDVLYPNVELTRIRAPAATIGRASSRRDEAADDSTASVPFLNPSIEPTKRRIPSAVIAPKPTPPAATTSSATSAASQEKAVLEATKQAIIAEYGSLGSLFSDEDGSGSSGDEGSSSRVGGSDACFAVVERRAPRVVFSQALRWQEPKATFIQTPTVKHTGSDTDSDPGNCAMAREVSLDVVTAYQHVLPHKGAPSFPRSQRFADSQQHKRQQQRASDQESRQHTGAGSSTIQDSKRQRLATPGVEAAQSFVRPRAAAVSFGHASVKEQMKQLLQERKTRAAAAAAECRYNHELQNSHTYSLEQNDAMEQQHANRRRQQEQQEQQEQSQHEHEHLLLQQLQQREQQPQQQDEADMESPRTQPLLPAEPKLSQQQSTVMSEASVIGVASLTELLWTAEGNTPAGPQQQQQQQQQPVQDEHAHSIQPQQQHPELRRSVSPQQLLQLPAATSIPLGEQASMEINTNHTDSTASGMSAAERISSSHADPQGARSTSCSVSPHKASSTGTLRTSMTALGSSSADLRASSCCLSPLRHHPLPNSHSHSLRSSSTIGPAPAAPGAATTNVAFGSSSPLRSRTPPKLPLSGFSKDPGPGSYDVNPDSISYLRRSTAVGFGTPPRDSRSSPLRSATAGRSPDRGADGSSAGAATALTPGAVLTWLNADMAAAERLTKPRVQSAIIMPKVVTPRAATANTHHEAEQQLDLEVKFTLVERGVTGVPIIRQPTPPRAAVAAESNSGLSSSVDWVQDPWALDAATRPKKPAWTFLQSPSDIEGSGHSSLATQWEGQRLELQIDDRALHPRAGAGVVSFGLGPTRFQDTPKRRARWPAVGDYFNLEAAWAYMAKHIPTAMIAAATHSPSHNPSNESNTTGPHGTTASAEAAQAGLLLRLSQALALTRPRLPAWTFAPLPVHSSRVPQRPAFDRGWLCDVQFTLVKRRLPGTVPFEYQLGRDQLEGPSSAAADTSLAPGRYDPSYSAVEPHVHGALEFSRAAPREVAAAPGAAQHLQEGEVLELDVAAAATATLPSNTFTLHMGLTLGREAAAAVQARQAFGALTRHLPLPGIEDVDPGVVRKRAPVARLESGTGHVNPAVEAAAADEAAQERGPGFYHDTLATLNALGANAAAPDFAHTTGRNWDTSDTHKGTMEGDILVLEPNDDIIRPSVPAALIAPLPPPPDPVRQQALIEEWRHRVTYDPDDDVAKRTAPRPPNFASMLGRSHDEARHATADGDESLQPTHDYHIEDVPLSVLAQHRAAPRALSFSKALTRALTPDGPRPDGRTPSPVPGDVLDLNPDQGLAHTRRRTRGVLPLALQQGHHDALSLTGLQDPELTAWLDYTPDIGTVRPAAPQAPAYERQLRRSAGVTGPETGDIDGGVYHRPRQHAALWPEPRAADFGSAATVERGAHLGPQRDLDEGNVLLLQPLQPAGWQAPAEDSHVRQPFGRKAERWRASADDAAAGAEFGPTLLLRTSMDDVGHQQRVTLRSAPRAVFGTAGGRWGGNADGWGGGSPGRMPVLFDATKAKGRQAAEEGAGAAGSEQQAVAGVGAAGSGVGLPAPLHLQDRVRTSLLQLVKAPSAVSDAAEPAKLSSKKGENAAAVSSAAHAPTNAQRSQQASIQQQQQRQQQQQHQQSKVASVAPAGAEGKAAMQNVQPVLQRLVSRTMRGRSRVQAATIPENSPASEGNSASESLPILV